MQGLLLSTLSPARSPSLYCKHDLKHHLKYFVDDFRVDTDRMLVAGKLLFHFVSLKNRVSTVSMTRAVDVNLGEL